MDKLTAISSFESIDRFHFLLTTIYQFIYSYPSLFHVVETDWCKNNGDSTVFCQCEYKSFNNFYINFIKLEFQSSLTSQ